MKKSVDGKNNLILDVNGTVLTFRNPTGRDICDLQEVVEDIKSPLKLVVKMLAQLNAEDKGEDYFLDLPFSTLSEIGEVFESHFPFLSKKE